MAMRIVAGAISTGFTRPQFVPSCVPRSSFLPVSIAVISIDAVVVGIAAVRVFTLGLFRQARDKGLGNTQRQSKALSLTTVGFFLWLAVGDPDCK